MKKLLGMVLLVASFGAAGHTQSTSYLVDSTLDMLFTVDLATGAATALASTANNGLTTPSGLTWRADTGQLWTIDLSDGEVGTIDTTTGVFTPIHQTGSSGWQGLEWDPATKLFYLTNQSGINYVLDPDTGVTQALGNSGLSLITCLEIDSTGTLYCFDFLTGLWCSVDKSTGAASPIGPSLPGFQGLSYDGATGKWYASNTHTDALYEIDPANGAATLIGAHGSGVQFAKGLEVADGGGSSKFCTAKAGLACGTPAIAASGVSSASATSGFTVSAARARPCRFGFLLYNTSSGAGVPFEGGVLCVTASGLQRAGSSNSGGTPGSSCDGRFWLDMNAFAAGTWIVPDCAGQPAGIPARTAAPFLRTPGQAVHAQWWGRDTVASGSFVSDGLMWTVGP
jgi:hypothetical protein